MTQLIIGEMWEWKVILTEKKEKGKNVSAKAFSAGNMLDYK